MSYSTYLFDILPTDPPKDETKLEQERVVVKRIRSGVKYSDDVRTMTRTLHVYTLLSEARLVLRL